jgi:ribonuclease-3
MHSQRLEKIIGHTFKNQDLFQEALTHPSLAHERGGGNHHNQRLEFLGDAVLQLVLTDRVYGQFPTFPEGNLTQLRAHLANRHTLCRRARAIHLGEFLLLGKGEEASGGRDRLSNLADAYEALLGAIYLDGGLRAARKFIRAQFKMEFTDLKQSDRRQNPKGRLQERLQADSRANPIYRVVHESGPDHNKHFEVVVEWQEREIGRGHGSSKKQAETSAAETALAGLEAALK